MKTTTKILKTLIIGLSLGMIAGLQAGTITVSATGVSSSPIFVTSALASITVGTELNIGTFLNTGNLSSTISTFKAGVIGTGNTLSEAQADADSKSTALYNQTLSWLSSSANFTSIVSAANTITQAGTTASNKFLFNNTASRTVNGISGNYAGSNGTFDVTYGNYGPGTGAQLWAWFATGTEIAIVTDSTWLVPVNNTAGLTVGTAQLASSGVGNPAELLLAEYVDYASGSDLIKALGITQTLNVIPEPSTAGLLLSGLGLVSLLRRRSIQDKRKNNERII